jgi:putative nucleotidyltransferase with HDIG domain
MSKPSSARTTTRRLWRWFLAPSPFIEGRDKRRQAALLSAFLLAIMVVAILVELGTIALIDWEVYTGYRQTFTGVFLLSIIYLISRTRHVQVAARLAVIISTLGCFLAGWAEPKGVLGGLFDFLILPLWLGSLYLGLREIFILVIVTLLGLLLFPLTTKAVTLNDILIGPFSFIFATSILLLVTTRHRNLLERDRRRELTEREQHSRHEAARTRALLRVAGRLNAQLDLDTLLQTLSEETAQALNTPISMVSLYKPKEDAIHPIIGQGLSSEQLTSIPPLPKSRYEQTINFLGAVFTLPDLQNIETAAYLQAFKSLNFRSMALATMEYERELIGNLVVISQGEPRIFTEDELLLLKGIADQAALAIVNTRLYKDAQRRLKNLQALRVIDIAIATNHDLRETMDVLLDKITDELSVDAAAILLLNEAKGLLEFGASQGFQTSSLRYFTLKVGEGMAGRAAEQRQILHVHNIPADPKELVQPSLLAREGFVSYYAAPLIAQGKVKGVLEVFHRSVLNPDDEWLNFLETLAGQAAIAIENTTLFEDLQKTNEELSRAYDSTIEGWSYALDLRDKETEGHTRRVTELTLELAKEFGFTTDELLHIRRGGLLHDIGKMGVPDRILLKETALEPDEWAQMKQHPVYAYEMLQPIDYLHEALDIPYCHHEKWDGSGYPRGLKGEEIPLAARIFAIVDVWDALTSDRPYRAAWDTEKTLAHIKQETGKHFDPHVVDLFTRLIEQKNRKKI